MRVIKLELMPELEALARSVCESEEAEPISLERRGSQVAVIVSSREYNALRKLEDALNDKLDVEESEEILKDPKWIGWNQVREQLKS